MRGGLGMDGRRSLGRIVEVLRGLDADVVCLQEVHRRLPWSGLHDQPGRLARALSLHMRFQTNYRLGIGTFGNLVLTRLPILSRRNLPVPNEVERRRPTMRLEKRGLLEVLVAAPAGPLGVLCTHWSVAAADRVQAAAVVGEAVRALEAPAVLAGDLNCPPDSPEIQALREASGLVDAGAAADEPTYPADAPCARIDYVLHPPEIAIAGLRVVDTLASDHRPVVVEW